ncbi:acyl-CoA oxidase [Ceraceosorus guamensis]|uniref:Acyl-coenzyme A oxidase n=1 Tax=Ceraceosorus guamensis TaxID=1522189 RepID=A0A316WEI3_9BASI|nr:acyl-CoA oxidase [Ceraceosorus guamensis]PWN45795.1 acyl-CoA oxidase [Ceraceosorus guamensis]
MTTSNAARPHPTSAPAGASSASSTYQPLGESKTGGRVPRVTLPVPIGNVASQTATDMQAARGKAAFDPAKIESILRDGRIDNDSRVKVVQTLDKDELFGDWKKRMAHMNREQKMTMSHKACRRLLEIAQRDEWTTHEIVDAAISLDLQSPITIHWVAFVPVIMGQGNDEQVARWGQRAMDHNILGCYLQTELGHGTNVAGLETLATYEPSTDTFDLHSPTLTSTKWWAGGSGLTATHGIVQAQLIINNKRFGPHLFFVPLRSLKDGKLFNGIAAGDIGPKTYDAFGGLDNGWVRFNHVKLPRDNMLAKHAQVKKGGEYVRPPSDKLSYGGMIFIRSQMIDRTGWMLSRGNTIAMRYSLVRRQFRDPDSKDVAEPERSVLSYPSLHRRLIPLLAKSYAYIIAGRRMRTLYEDMAAQLDSGDTSLLADVHVASSSLKAYCTKQALDGIEECRQALGGHGFSAYAGYTSIFPDNAPTVTYEGDNYVLAQQVGRAMLKTAGELDKNAGAKVSNTTSFLGALKNKDAVKFSPPTSPAEWLKPEVYTAVLGLRAARRVADLRADLSTGRRFVDLSWECVEVARSHAEVVVNAWFTEGVSDDSEGFGSDATYWLNKLVVLHALTCVARDITPLVLPAAQGRGLAAYQSGSAILTPESVLHLETAIRDLHTELLPQVIALTDAFGWTDWELSSSLGRKDGRVYESLMAEAEGNPINHPAPKDSSNPDNLGHYQYGSSLVGKHVAASWKAEIEPLLRTQNKLAEEGPIKGDGSKL